MARYQHNNDVIICETRNIIFIIVPIFVYLLIYFVLVQVFELLSYVLFYRYPITLLINFNYSLSRIYLHKLYYSFIRFIRIK